MFSGQIFADFCGYSTVARGLGYLLGYHFPINFNAPYIAATFKSFWERWHITLSRWLRDYLYVPLGGNRISPRRTYVNLLAVMLLGGLWHGAAYTFIAWGAIHGTCLAVERLVGLHRGLPTDAGRQQRQRGEDVDAAAQVHRLADQVLAVDRHQRLVPQLPEHTHRRAAHGW